MNRGFFVHRSDHYGFAIKRGERKANEAFVHALLQISQHAQRHLLAES